MKRQLNCFFLILGLILFSCMLDGYLAKLLPLVLVLFGLYFFCLFLVCTISDEFLFRWVVGLLSVFFFSVALCGQPFPFWPSSALFIISGILGLRPYLIDPDTNQFHFQKKESTLFWILFLFASVFSLFLSLVEDGTMVKAAWFCWTFEGLFLIIFYFAIIKLGNLQTILSLLLIAASFYLGCRRYLNDTRLLWIVLIQPLIGLLSLHLFIYIREKDRALKRV